MTITTVTSRKLNQDISKVKKVCEVYPVYVTNLSEPTHVMMTFYYYQKLVGNISVVELLAMDDTNIKFESAKLNLDLFNVTEFL